MATMYHVAGTSWTPGDDLLAWCTLADLGLELPGVYEDAPTGWDGEFVCLYPTLAEAEEHIDEFGGAAIVEVDVPDADDAAWDMLYDMRRYSGYISPRLTTCREGYVAVERGIPAAWLFVLRDAAPDERERYDALAARREEEDAEEYASLRREG
jgi:hypothetical protein